MKFLVDNQLPPALARFIAHELGAEALHVADVNMRESSDAEVWRYASDHDFILVSKDEDFLTLLGTAPGAKLLWVRVGNCRKGHLLDVFRQLWPRITGRFAGGEHLVEIR